MRRKIFGSAGALPSRKPLAIRYSPFAIRHSLPFWLGRSLALPISPPTEVGVYEKRSLLFGLRVAG
jgi:hypothetical protein